jgi:uncharacterized protein (DUF58 family)
MFPTAHPSRPATIDELIDPGLASRLTAVDVTSRKVFAGKVQGERRSKKRGESVEFADHRPYVVGDDLRHIDWNIYARLDRLFLKLFLEEEDLSVQILVDASGSMACGEPEKFAFAQRMGAALAYIGLVNMNRVAVSAIGGGARGSGIAKNLRGRRSFCEAGRYLCGLDAGGALDFTQEARRIALSRRGKGVMILLSDLLYPGGYEEGLRMLVGRGYDLVVIQTLSPEEIEPTLAGDLKLKDVETGLPVELTVSAPLLEQYRKHLAGYREELEQFCARREITMLSVSTEIDPSVLLLEYLRERGVLR